MDRSLIFQTSPLCPLAAEVVESDTCIYFYLYDLNFEEEKLETRSACWVKNRIPAPETFDIKNMEEGHAPALPKVNCINPDDYEGLQEDALSIVWSKEGHIAALYEGEKLLCIIPSWAVPGEVPGFCVNIKESHMCGCELNDDNVLIPRIKEGKAFWEQDFQVTWMEYSNIWLGELAKRYGEPKECLRLSEEEQFPTIFLMIYEKDDVTYAFTAGMGMFSMPNVDQYIEDYDAYAKNEFAFHWKKGYLKEEEEHMVYQYLAGISALPWQCVDFIGHGHTLDFNIKQYAYAICVQDTTMSEIAKKLHLHVLDLVCITEQEFQEMRKSKSHQTIMDTIKKDQRAILGWKHQRWEA